MADPKAIQFLEGIYSRVDKQVRDVVTSMLPNMTVAAQDDGTVVTNNHRILNFQGAGVSVSDDSVRRRVNILIPGDPIVATTTTVASAAGTGKVLAVGGPGLSCSVRDLYNGSYSNPVGTHFQLRENLDAGTATIRITSTNIFGLGGVNSQYVCGIANVDGSIVHQFRNEAVPNGQDRTDSETISGDFTGWFAYVQTTDGGSGNTNGAGITNVEISIDACQGPASEPSGWQTVGFNDSSWTAAIASSTNYDSAGYGRPTSATWVTQTNSATPGPGYEFLVRHSFTTSGTPTSISVQANVDDIGDYYLDGTFIGSISDTHGVSSPPVRTFTAAPSVLVAGTSHVLAIRVRNTSQSSPAGVAVVYRVDAVTGTGVPSITTDNQSANTVLAGPSSGAAAPPTFRALVTADIPGGGGGMSNPMTTQDDIIVGGSSGTPARLAKGTDSQVLTIDPSSHHVAWATPAAGGGTVPAARVYHNTTQTVANTTLTWIVFNSERFDTDTIHDTSTNTGRLTCKTAGTYLIVGNFSFPLNFNGSRQIRIRLNGATIIAITAMTPTSSAATDADMEVSTIYALAVNDYVELGAYQTSGGTLTIAANANYSPEFSMTRIG